MTSDSARSFAISQAQIFELFRCQQRTVGEGDGDTQYGKHDGIDMA